MADEFEEYQLGLESPPTIFETVTPSDSVALDNVTRALGVGTGGDVAVVSLLGVTTVIPNVQDGTLMPGRFIRIDATNTTASGMVGES